MKKEDVKKLPSLSWTEAEYAVLNEEAPECLAHGLTEGESFDEEQLSEWLADEIRSLSVMQEDYPESFEEHYRYFCLDLDYLCSLGKISTEECDALKKKDNFNFGQK